MRTAPLLIAFSSLLALSLTACEDQAPDGNAAATAAAIDAPADISYRLHGTLVADPYRALEDWSDPRVQTWSDQQTAEARQYLDQLPEHAKLVEELTALLSAKSQLSYGEFAFRNSHVFAVRHSPGAKQPALVYARSLDDLTAAKVVVDMMALDPSGLTTIDWYVPSPDGKKVAASLSSGGSERGALYLFDVESGRQLEEPIPNIYNPTAGGDVAWDADNAGLHYTRYPQSFEAHANEPSFYLKLFHHRLGAEWRRDPLALGETFDRVAQIRLVPDAEHKRLIAWVQDGDSGRFAMYLKDPQKDWRKFSAFDDQHFQATFGDGDDIFVLSNRDAPHGKIIKLSARTLDWETAQTIAPDQDDASLVHSYYSHGSPTMLWSHDRLFVRYEAGGPTKLVIFDRDGAKMPSPAQQPVSSTFALTATPQGAIFAVQSYTRDTEWFSYDVAAAKTQEISDLIGGPAAKWADIEVKRIEAVSKDGTHVPVTILVPPNAQPGISPLLVTGYGGFRISMHPRFQPELRALLDRGVIFAEANIRGGGEFGEPWHAAGILTHKQNVFDDFAAAIQTLQTQGYGAPKNTAIVGASNGGLLMGAMVAQRPELVNAVVAQVGIYDMLRVELDPNGIFNIPEYGTVKNPEQFEALYKYSPYHNITKGTPYPAVLFTTGANDQRVNPMHSRKMVARLRDASGSDQPILLLASRNAGHGHGLSLDRYVEHLADTYAFILSQTEAP